MTRMQIQQIVVSLLLVAFCGVWLMTRSISSRKKLLKPYQEITDVPIVRVGSISEPEESLPESSDPPGAAPRVRRDPFRLPSLLVTRIAQRKADREKLTHRQAFPRTARIDPSSVAAQRPKLVVQGIFWGIASPQVLINRQILSVGDEIEGTKILAVTKEGVTVSYQGQKYKLELPTTDHGEGGL